MNLSYSILNEISKIYGHTFYLLNSRQFAGNFRDLLKAFRDIYPKSQIAYSYKTNYTPKLCKLVNQLGGLAEVVSGMEYAIARKAGVLPQQIIFNGPCKDEETLKQLLLAGGTVNIDSDSDLQIVQALASKHPGNRLSVGLRCNFDIGDGVRSRFGFDVDGDEFTTAIETIRKTANINLNGLHCHFATRSLETWTRRADGMLNLVQKYFHKPPLFVNLGGGLFGKMSATLKAQFDVEIPSYEDYAKAVAPKFKEYYKHLALPEQPLLIIEPGTALVADAMCFATKVVNIKTVRGKNIATLTGSIYNINPTLNQKNPPIAVYHDPDSQVQQKDYSDLNFGGYTCIESDYLYRGFSGKLAEGDYVVFGDIGSYSVVLKPPFIMPNCAILDYDSASQQVKVVKRAERFDDLFHTFTF